MLNLQKLLREPFVKEIETAYRQTYGLLHPEYANILGWCCRLGLENIANCDSLYHNVEHTMLVTLVGQEILRGKHLTEGGVAPENWLHFIIALLCHDIGYIKGVCKNDNGSLIDSGVDGKMVEVCFSGTDAALTPYHVDRGKLFVRERFNADPIDSEILASYIEMTRFPIPKDETHKNTKGFPGLVRAADLIGQLGDSDYLRKLPALFYEFEETGVNKQMGYKNPGELRKGFAKFFWNAVEPYIRDAMKYLQVTQEGKQWIANLHSHVFAVEHSPQDGCGTPML
ncbi:MAG: metal-dependent phosphohydrolase [bacterium]|nr:metal-dependent phosphohydrolase [bacterium]